MLDILSLADGASSSIDLADKIGLPAWQVDEMLSVLESHALIDRCSQRAHSIGEKVKSR